MAENLNYKTGNSLCYNNDESNCKKYGRLYDWGTAVKACPGGWRLPDTAGWNRLMAAVGGVRKTEVEDDEVTFVYDDFAGKKLKSKSGWEGKDNGTDEFGFSALPGGYRFSDVSFCNAGIYGLWWSATEYGAGSAYFRSMDYDDDGVVEDNGGKSGGISVRCVAQD
jgi:uncharacterized protein (TIGR02145 family)